MAPIYDSDIAEQRWDKTSWEQYELWEKVEHRLKRHKRLWIAATAVVFIALSSVPIVMDRSGKWSTLGATRRLAEEINRLKKDAGRDHVAYRIRFEGGGSLAYRIEKATSCSDPRSAIVGGGNLVGAANSKDFLLLNQAEGEKLGIPGLLGEICYDYLSGSDVILKGEAMAGFGVIPAKDLAENRTDRVSVLLVNGMSAELAFE